MWAHASAVVHDTGGQGQSGRMTLDVVHGQGQPGHMTLNRSQTRFHPSVPLSLSPAPNCPGLATLRIPHPPSPPHTVLQTTCCMALGAVRLHCHASMQTRALTTAARQLQSDLAQRYLPPSVPHPLLPPAPTPPHPCSIKPPAAQVHTYT
eukprot:355890-Chlamydomonas_euryale.AAC.2